MPVLFVRLDQGLHAEIAAVAERAGVSGRDATEALWSQSLGLDHPLWPALQKAIRAHKRERTTR